MTDKEKKHIEEDEFSERTIVAKIKKADGEPEQEKAYILFISGPLMGKMYYLEEKVTIIGRDKDCSITITDPRISRHHLRISLVGGQAVIEDLGSTNGTFVNGERVQSRELKNSDRIHISSDTLFNFATGSEAERMFHEAMHQMANYDAVTGIHNKHVFARRFREEFSFAKRSNLSLSLLMIDIDFFKKVNDAFGHMAGDYVLQGVARRIQKAVRDEDILARYGGEEFVVILRGTDKEGAALLAERVRGLVEAEPFLFEQEKIPVTISIGVASLAGDNLATPEEMIARADACLYKSKENGRNRVTA